MTGKSNGHIFRNGAIVVAKDRFILLGLLTSAAAEHAWLRHSHRVGFSLDLAKAFDRIPHQILYHLLVASGVPVNFCDMWLGAIRDAKKFLKSAYGLGRAFHVNLSFGALGCGLSAHTLRGRRGTW